MNTIKSYLRNIFPSPIWIFFSIVKRKFYPKQFFYSEVKFLSNLLNYLVYTSVIYHFYIEKIKRDPYSYLKTLIKKMNDGQILHHAIENSFAHTLYWDSYLEGFKDFKDFNISEELKSAVVIDIGAHQGFFSCRGQWKNKDAKFYCIEPDPKNYEILNKNSLLIGNENIKTYNILLSDRSAEVEFFLGRSLSTGSIENIVIGKKLNNGSIPIKSLTFEDFLDLNNIGQIDFLKCDVEGGEYKIFNNPNQLLKTKFLAIEMHTVKDIKPRDTYLYAFIQDNFECYEKQTSQTFGDHAIEIFGINKQYLN